MLHLLEKADVLDRDYGLVGKGLDKFDLAIGEGPGFRSRHCEDANYRSFAHERYTEHSRITSESRSFGKAMFGVLGNIRNMDHCLVECCSADPGLSVDRTRIRLFIRAILRGLVVASRKPEDIAFAHKDARRFRTAEPHRRIDKCLQDALQVECGAAYDL